MKNLLFLLLPFLTFAQTHRFIYEFQYKQDSLSKDFGKENMILDINPSEVKFYPYAYAELDSLNMKRGQRNSRWDDHLPAIIRKRESNDNTSLILITDLFALKSLDKLDWKLHSETKVEGAYTLQKATAHFGGRFWIAWFSKEVAISEGPYKFRGLPGLIFEIGDDKNNFIFKLINSRKFPKTYETPFLNNPMGKSPIVVSEKIIHKKQLEFYNDPLRSIAESFKANTSPDNTFYVSGVQIKSIDQLKGMADESRERIRKNNNPIEIDKAIQYPNK